MLDKIQDLVKQYAGEALGNNPDITESKKEEVVTEASGSIMDGLKDAVSKGDTGELMNLFKGGSKTVMNSGISQHIQAGFMQKLTSKLGFDSSKAGIISSTLIPFIMEKLVHKTNDASDSSFDIQGIIKSLVAGEGVGDLLNKFTGNGEKEEGGMLGKIKGMF